ncbi:Krr1-domain-containing protein [Atractiella rhizophila]|nr:Krr1-domain-containing protein [Atractiella rhizophila]
MAPRELLSSSSSSGSDSDSEPESGFKINAAFAEKYEARKKGEELSKLQDKYGPGATLDDESDSEEDLSTDDEDAEFLTPAVDLAVLRTLKRIREGQGVEEGRNVFEEEEEALATQVPSTSKSSKSSKPSKPLNLKEFQLKSLLKTKGGSVPDETPLTMAEESVLLQEETKRAFHDASSDDDGGFLVRREGSKRRQEEESDEEFQKIVAKSLGLKKGQLAEGLKKITSGDAEEGEDFLAAYVLNRGWIDKKKGKKIPSYGEVIGADAGPEGFDQTLADGDSEFEDRADDFESKYNFRFEEQEGASLATHARSLDMSVRQPSAHTLARKRGRDAKAERKKEKEEELRRMQELEKEERKKKLERVKEQAGKGVREMDLEQLDLEGDFDEKEHERLMQKVYGDDFYGAVDEDGKPVWDDDIDIDDILADIPPSVADNEDEEDYEEDEAYDPSNPGPKGKRAKQNQRRKEKKRAKAAAGREEEEEEEEKDPFSHIVVDPTKKFEYATVDVRDVDNSLTPAEIMLATDVELNELMSLKKLAPYRSLDEERSRSKKKYQWRLKDLKAKLESRQWGKAYHPEAESRDAKLGKRKREGDAEEPKKKRKGKKEREKVKARKALEE